MTNKHHKALVLRPRPSQSLRPLGLQFRPIFLVSFPGKMLAILIRTLRWCSQPQQTKRRPQSRCRPWKRNLHLASLVFSVARTWRRFRQSPSPKHHPQDRHQQHRQLQHRWQQQAKVWLLRLNRNRFNSKGQKGQLWLRRQLCNQWLTPSLDLHLPLRKPKLHTAQGSRQWQELRSKAPMPKAMPKVQWKKAWDRGSQEREQLFHRVSII